MKTTKITQNEIRSLKVSSLPTRPTAPAHLGGRGYTAEEMKAAFDRLPIYIIERFNQLIEDIYAVGEESLAGAIKTGILEGQSLSTLFCDLKSGKALSYIGAGDSTLAEELASIRARLTKLEGKNE